MGKELTTDIFIKRSVDKHGDLYDYSLVDYKKMKEKVDIRCVKHDIKFKQSPLKHLDSKTGGCPMCNSIGKGKLTTEVFIKKSKLVHNNLYDYRFVEYKKSNTKVRIICIKDKIKSDFCKNNGIKLLRIPYYEYKNIHKILENEI
jgi:hypothetical protein